MDVFIARQPIFDRSFGVYAQELLFRLNRSEHFDISDADRATASILADLLKEGHLPTSDRQRYSINFTPHLIREGVPFLFPKENIIIEFPTETIPEPELIQMCIRLKEGGYTIALDNFTITPNSVKLIPHIELLKVNFITTEMALHPIIVELAKENGLELVAHKLENQTAFEQAKALGYNYFQGYFFCHPIIEAKKDIAPNQLSILELIQLSNSATDNDIQAIEAIIRRDISLSVKLLKLLNSPAIGVRNKVSSIHQAVKLLGFANAKKWITVVALSQLGDALPVEVMRTTLLRSTMCELIAKSSSHRLKAESASLVGAFSLLETFMGIPLCKILPPLRLSEEIQQALLLGSGPLGAILRLVTNYEQGEWSGCTRDCQTLGVPVESLSHFYLQSIRAAQSIVDQLTS